MPGKTKRTITDRSEFFKYKTLADNFYKGAIEEMKSGRWNPAGVLMVHSAIAYADAASIKYGGVKN